MNKYQQVLEELEYCSLEQMYSYNDEYNIDLENMREIIKEALTKQSTILDCCNFKVER